MSGFVGSAVIAKTVINGLVAVLQEQGIDVNTMQFSLKGKDGEETPELDFYRLVNYASLWLEQVQNEEFLIVRRDEIKGYFSNDGDNYEVHDTLDQAKHKAEGGIEYFREQLADQQSDPRSDGNFQQIGYGIVLAQSAYSLDHIVTQEDVDSGNYNYEVGTEILNLHLDACTIDGVGE